METAVCTKCGKRKDIENFWPRPSRPGGRFKQCRQCMTEARGNRSSVYMRQRMHNISDAEYMEMYRDQDGLCAICRKRCTTGRLLACDHRHEDGMRRGLLCMKCNRGLGFFLDDAELLLAAAEYLQQFPALRR